MLDFDESNPGWIHRILVELGVIPSFFQKRDRLDLGQQWDHRLRYLLHQEPLKQYLPVKTIFHQTEQRQD